MHALSHVYTMIFEERNILGWRYFKKEWDNPITKEHTWYALTDKRILAQKLRISKIQFETHETQEEGRPKCGYFVPS